MNDLPTGWARAVVDDVTIEVRSGFASGKHNATGDGIAHLRPMNVSRLGEIDLKEVKYVDPAADDRRLEPGDILFNNTNSPALVGKTALVRQVAGEQAFSNHMTRLRTVSGVVPAFLAAQLHFLWMTGRLSHLITNHVNQASISAKVLSRQVQVVLPPTAEQERIVAAIEEHLSRLDAVESAIGPARTKLDGLRKSTISEVLNRRAWPMVSWSDVGETLSGRAFPSASYGDGGTRLLRPGNLNKSGRVTWAPKATTHLPDSFAADSPKYLLRGRHLLMNLTAQSLADGFLGRVCMSDEDDYFLLNQRIARLASPLANSDYLFWVFRSSSFRRFVAGLNTGSLIQHISTKQLAAFVFPLPPLDDQPSLVQEIEAAVAAIDRTEMALELVFRRASQLRRSILAAAFAGQLVPQDPDDEPAFALLDRIRAERASVIPSKRTRKAKAS